MRKVTYAKLHTSSFIPGVGTMGDTLPPSHKSTKLEMSYSDSGLEVIATEKGITTTVLFPPGTVAMVAFAPEPKVAKAS